MTIEILFALVLMLGIASGVAQPSRLALIPTLVDRESLASALAMDSRPSGLMNQRRGSAECSH
jgi:hypothetical protein